MSDRHAVFLDYYDRERVQPALVFFRHRAASLERRGRYLDIVAGILALAAVGAALAFGLEKTGLGAVALWMAVMGPALALSVAVGRAMQVSDREHARCHLAYVDLERMRIESFPDPTGSTADVESYVDMVEAFLAVAPYRHT